MPYTPILGSLGYVLSPDRDRVLLVHRNARADDQHLGKYNGLGGKMEPGEDIVGCMRRELLEEAGITATAMTLRGTINWTGFGPHGEDWLGFIFLITGFDGEPFTSNEEGTLDWQKLRARREEFVYDSGCLTCHQNLEEATADHGFHIMYFENITDSQCATCHTEVGHANLNMYLLETKYKYRFDEDVRH